MNLNHRQAFALLHCDRPLSTDERRHLDEHLSACAECRADQALYADLQTAAQAHPLTAARTRPHAELVAAVKGRFRRQRAAQRLLQPLASLGWAAAALLLVAALSWVIGALRPLSATPASSPAPSAGQPTPISSTGQSTPIPCSAPIYYIVQPGDTFASIAAQYEVTVQSIKSFNYLPGNATIQAGQVLEIPVCTYQNLPALQRWFLHLLQPLQWTWVQFTWDHPWLAGMLPAILLALVGVLLSLRRDYPWAEQAWLAVLLFALGLAMTLLRITYNTTSPLPFILVPLGGSALAALILHWWATPVVRTLPMKLLLGVSLLALLALNLQPGWAELARLEQILILVMGGLCALLWRAWEVGGRARRAAFAFLILSLLCGAAMLFWPPALALPALPEWMRAVIVVLAVFSIPACALLAGWLAYARLVKPGALAKAGKLSSRTLLLTLAGIALLCAVLFAVLWDTTIASKVDDDTITVWIFYFLAAAGALAALLAAAWRLDGRRKLLVVLVTACFLLALAPATRGPAATAEELTLQRAGQVDQAIQRFHARTGRYPSDLGELTPWTLWRIPAPVTFFQQVWCYEGGPDFYRLGYYYSPEFFHWQDIVEVRIYASAGPQPAAPSQCEIELEELRQRWP